jgi:hypothetical protein
LADLALDLVDRAEPSPLDRLLLAAAEDERVTLALLELVEASRRRVAERARLARILPVLPEWARADLLAEVSDAELAEAVELVDANEESPWASLPVQL